MSFSWKRWTRRLHRWGAVITFVPLLLVICTGLLLQVKKQLPWVQPPTAKGSESNQLLFDWENTLELLKTYDDASVSSWEDVERIDVRPGKGVAKIRCQSSWELQIDLVTGEPLSFNYRRSDLIESLHDGSFFNEGAKLWVFLPNGLILLGLLGTGAYLWWMPIGARRKKKNMTKKRVKPANDSAN